MRKGTMPASGYRAVNHVKNWRSVIEKSRTARTNRISYLALHAHKRSGMQADAALRRSARMLLLCQLKCRRIIATVMGPPGKDDPDPNVGKRSHRYRMAFAFNSLALVGVSGPRFTLRALPGELMKRVAQRLDT